MRTKDLIKDFYYNYKNIIDFNKNIIFSAIITAICDVAIVVVASFMFQNNSFLISLISSIADFIIFNSIFLFLLLNTNRKKQQYYSSPLNRSQMKILVAKLVTLLGFAEISYLVTKFFSTHIFLEYINLTSSQVSVTTTILSWLVYLSIANIMAKKTKFYSGS